MEAFFYTLFYISVFIPLLPLISVLLNAKQLSKTHLITITLIPICNITTDVVSWLLAEYKNYSNGIQHIYTFAMGSLLWYYFYSQFRNKWYLILGGYMVFTALCVLVVILWGGLDAVNTISNTTLGILVIFFALAYFVKAINELKYNSITHDLDFWINFALLLLYG